jgi:hypothetical protein
MVVHGKARRPESCPDTNVTRNGSQAICDRMGNFISGTQRAWLTAANSLLASLTRLLKPGGDQPDLGFTFRNYRQR